MGLTIATLENLEEVIVRVENQDVHADTGGKILRAQVLDAANNAVSMMYARAAGRSLRRAGQASREAGGGTDSTGLTPSTENLDAVFDVLVNSARRSVHAMADTTLCQAKVGVATAAVEEADTAHGDLMHLVRQGNEASPAAIAAGLKVVDEMVLKAVKSVANTAHAVAIAYLG